jgi:hypothetical protein
MSAILFTIEIYFKVGSTGYPIGESVSRYVLRNMTTGKLKEFREVIISAGLMMPFDPEVKNPGFLDQWKIVLPWNIISIDVYKQSKFYSDGDNTKKN